MREEPLTTDLLAVAVTELSDRDRDLRDIVERFGPPPLWARRPGFATPGACVLEQQVSLASAAATYERLRAVAGRITPTALDRLTDAHIRGAGVTRQKTRTCRHLVQAVDDGRLDLRALRNADERRQRAVLTSVSGIGPWTADIFILMAWRRPDIWPAGDLALDRALAELKPRGRDRAACAVRPGSGEGPS